MKKEMSLHLRELPSFPAGILAACSGGSKSSELKTGQKFSYVYETEQKT